jgi:hypothetical protein
VPTRATQLLIALPLLVLPGCQMNERLSGTVGGAVGGGLLAAVVGASAGGVLATAAGGALAGYLIGDYLADQRERCCGCPSQSPCGVPQSPCQAPIYYPESPCQVAPGGWTQTAPVVTPARFTPAPNPAARIAYERGRGAVTSEEAVRAYEESIRLDPTRPEPWNALALHSIVTGDTTTARQRLEKALTLDPHYGPAQHNLKQLGSK